jgi:hypothetical protein
LTISNLAMNDCVTKRAAQKILCFFMKLFIPQLNQFCCIFCHIGIIVVFLLLLINCLIVKFVLLFKHFESWFLLFCFLYLVFSLSEHQVCQVERTCVLTVDLAFGRTFFDEVFQLSDVE